MFKSLALTNPGDLHCNVFVTMSFNKRMLVKVPFESFYWRPFSCQGCRPTPTLFGFIPSLTIALKSLNNGFIFLEKLEETLH